MSNDVYTLLARARQAPAGVSALDAVMGEDWAVVAFDEERRPPEMRAALEQAHADNTAPRGGGSPRATLPGLRQQAVVKMVAGGGVASVGAMKSQMRYLSREGEDRLTRSERFMGEELDAEAQEELARSWRLPPEESGHADRTAHFIVSFPEHASHGAAERAGREWAAELFESGAYGGDVFDYYTAFHTDRDHPHMHVVVHRRGAENGEWLKVSKRSDLNFDAMRDELVRAAEREGIEVEATRRLERAIHARPVPDAEYRRAEAQERAPVAPEHTPETATLAAAGLIENARRFAADARLLAESAPRLAGLLDEASERLAHGIALTEGWAERSIDREEMRGMSERVETAREKVRDNFRELDATAAELRGAERVQAERQIADLKAQSAQALPERDGMRAYTREDTSGRYDGMAGRETERPDVARQADDRVRAVAERYGVDRDAAVERRAAGRPSEGLARDYARTEGEERDASRRAAGAARESEAERSAALGEMRGEIGAIYAQARERVDRERATPERPEQERQEPEREEREREERDRQKAARRDEADAGRRAQERQRGRAPRPSRDRDDDDRER